MESRFDYGCAIKDSKLFRKPKYQNVDSLFQINMMVPKAEIQTATDGDITRQ